MAAGAAAGTVAGPVGTAIGAAVGAIAGGLAGHGIAELVDPTVEEVYWRENYSSRPYVAGDSFDEFAPAYRYGVSSYSKYHDRTFDDVEDELSRDWNAARGTSSLEWDRARLAAKDSWQRVSDTVERAIPGDSDRDGK
jgi:ABC-type cobalamin transport system ATPase subunit